MLLTFTNYGYIDKSRQGHIIKDFSKQTQSESIATNRFNIIRETSMMMYKVKNMKKKLITIREAAKILEVNPETLRRWDRKGKFKAKRHPINGYRLYDRDAIKLLRNKIQNGGVL